jgi:PrgI family protein
MSDQPSYGARIPADVEREDLILARLTARQVAILAAAAVVLWLAFIATRDLVPLAVYAVLAFPFGAFATVLALGRRDGLSLDRLLLAAIKQARAPRRLVVAPEGVAAPPKWIAPDPAPLPAPLRLPVQAISADGVIDLGADGAAVICAASTVSFALRTVDEQLALVGVFARWLNSLTAPMQILVRAQDVDVTPLITGLTERAPGLPHPALEQAALEHAAFISQLTGRRDLLRRQVLIVLREPHSPAGRRPASRGAARRPDAVAGQRVLRRADEAARALGSAEIAVQVLDGGQAAAVLGACGNPFGSASPAVYAQAAPGDVITFSGGPS